jgi:predicted nuclease with TOPRIM domain
MSQLSEIVDSLENRISKLLHRYEKLKQHNARLEEEMMQLKSKQEDSQQQIDAWIEKFEAIKMANSMLGSDQYKRDTKLKINALVREIDQCIAQLSE